MGWKGVTVMDQRVRFIAEYLKGYFPSMSCAFNSVSAGRPATNGWSDMNRRTEGLRTDHDVPIPALM